MKPRLLLIALVLILFPTAALTLLASRALQAREVILQAEMERRAEGTIRTVADRMDSLLESELDLLRSATAECLSRGGRYHDVDRVASRLREKHPVVGQVYLFMNPLGMMYPQKEKVAGGQLSVASGGREEPEDAAKKDSASARNAMRGGAGGADIRPGWDFIPLESWSTGEDDLVQTLKNRLGASVQPGAPVFYSFDDNGYCFIRLFDNSELHVGFEVSRDGMLRVLASTLKSLSGKDLALAYEASSWTKEDIKVQDPFGVGGAQVLENSGHAAGTAPESLLAAGNLRPPLGDIKIYAYPRDPLGRQELLRFQARLFAWGILVATVGICVGVWLLFRISAAEVQRARARSEFVVGVSHDLRTPISSMKILAETLHLDHVKDDNKRKEFLKTIASECDRLADMIERVLFFVREEQGGAVYSFESTDIASLVSDTVNAFSGRTRGSAEVRLDMDKDLPMVRIDAGAMGKVLINLLDNAVKYSRGARGKEELNHRGAEPLRSALPESMNHSNAPITIDVALHAVERRGRSWVAISVRDYGVGIEKKELKRVFRKFYRASIESSGTVGGVGLGLALCRSIVRAHKGRIEAQSSPGKGSDFTVYLPGKKRIPTT